MHAYALKKVVSMLISLSAALLLILPNNNESHTHRQLETVVEPRLLSRVGRLQGSLDAVPEWVRNYVAWHKEQRLNHLNDPNTKFLTVICHKGYGCGGLSDRLRAMPYFLLAANKTGRVLFIHWQKFRLEDFLVPPEGGLDWTLPKEFYEKIGDGPPRRQVSCLHWSNPYRPCAHIWNYTNPELDRTQNIVINAREDLYADVRDEYFVTPKQPKGTYEAVMNPFFQPSIGVHKLFRETMRKLGLKPNQYLAAHFRDHYPSLGEKGNRDVFKMPQQHKEHLLHNAINCAVHKSGIKNMPIYFTSDKPENVQYLLNDSPYAAKNNPPVKVVGIEDDFNRVNLDVKVNTIKYQPHDLYSIFVDILIFAHSKCVSHGMGGYGLLGARMRGERCMIQHQVAWNATDCPSLL